MTVEEYCPEGRVIFSRFARIHADERAYPTHVHREKYQEWKREWKDHCANCDVCRKVEEVKT